MPDLEVVVAAAAVVVVVVAEEEQQAVVVVAEREREEPGPDLLHALARAPLNLEPRIEITRLLERRAGLPVAAAVAQRALAAQRDRELEHFPINAG